MTRYRYALLVICLMLPLSTFAQAPPTLLDYTWTVGVCKTKQNADCTDLRKLKPGATFGVMRDSANDHWLRISLQTPRMDLSIPVENIRETTDVNGVKHATFEFWDFSDDTVGSARKQMRIEFVRQASSTVGKQTCPDKLNGLMGGDFGPGERHGDQCEHDDLVYWSITTQHTVSDGDINVDSLGPPGDGHGTGSGGGQ